MIMSPANTVTYNGKKLSDFGIYISGKGTYNSPERDYTLKEVSGRSGDLLIDNGRFKNVDLEYEAFFNDVNFGENIDAFRQFMLKDFGYHELSDTYHPDEFREAIFTGPFEPDVLDGLETGSFTLKFKCKPQRFLVSGKTTTQIGYRKVGDMWRAYLTITNTTDYIARPLLVFSNTAKQAKTQTFTVSNGSYLRSFKLTTNTTGSLSIDSEDQEAFDGTKSLNSNLDLTGSSYEFPVLYPGTTTFGGFVQNDGWSLTITPRWWKV